MTEHSVDRKALEAFHASMGDGLRKDDNPLGYQWMYRVGKRAVGRLLDGRNWAEFPDD